MGLELRFTAVANRFDHRTCAFIVVVAIGARQTWLTANQQPLDPRNGDLIGAIN